MPRALNTSTTGMPRAPARCRRCLPPGSPGSRLSNSPMTPSQTQASASWARLSHSARTPCAARQSMYRGCRPGARWPERWKVSARYRPVRTLERLQPVAAPRRASARISAISRRRLPLPASGGGKAKCVQMSCAVASFPSSGGGGSFRKKGLHPFSPFPRSGLRPGRRLGVCQLFALPQYVIMHSRLVSVFAFLKPGRAPAGTGGRNAREGNGFPSEKALSPFLRFPLPPPIPYTSPHSRAARTGRRNQRRVRGPPIMMSVDMSTSAAGNSDSLPTHLVSCSLPAFLT